MEQRPPRLRIRTIVAATDLSRAAYTAVQRAALIARAHGASLELLHVVSRPSVSNAWREMLHSAGLREGQLRDQAAQQLREVGALVRAEFGVEVTTHVAEGKPYAEIAARIEALDPDLVVVGAHGENALLTPVLGTTAHRVLRLSGAPVLLSKQEVPAPYANVVIATDFSEHAAWAAKCARPLVGDAGTTFVHVQEDAQGWSTARGALSQAALEQYRTRALEESKAKLDAFVAALSWPAAHTVVLQGAPAMRLREYARDNGADLIVFGAAGRPAVLGSVSMRLVTDAHCDVLLA